MERNDPRITSKERLGQLAEQSNRQIARLERLIDDMLDISRIRTGRLTLRPEEIEVLDRGMGIAPEDHERIFERFERVVNPSEVSGLGLGLFIARQIVRAHGGDVRVESQLGHGSNFIVEIPRASVTAGEGVHVV